MALTERDIDTFRSAIEDELANLDRAEMAGQEDRRIVELDQQSVGRLSRVDALQRQAMAQASARRREGRRARLKAALGRIEDGEFGYCLDCGEPIATKRLELDPTTPTCMPCVRG